MCTARSRNSGEYFEALMGHGLLPLGFKRIPDMEPPSNPGRSNLMTAFRFGGTPAQALEFCNRFNTIVHGCRATYQESTRDADGGVYFQFDRLTFPEEIMEAKHIVQMVRIFADAVISGVQHLDEDGLF